MNWKLTPTEPDDGMIEVAEEMILERIQFGCTVYAADVYDTMLSAAPDPLEDAELVERGARAIYDAIDPTSGDSIAHTLHMSEYIDDSVPVPQQLEQVMEICRSASRAIIAAMKGE